MVLQISVFFICCSLMFLGGLVKADKGVAREANMRSQLYADVFILKDGIYYLGNDLKILKEKSNSQIDLLEDIKSQTENQNSDDNVCDRISGFFNDTHRKFNMFEERIITKLDEIHEEQSTSINKYIVSQNIPKQCQQGSALDVISSALPEINEKIDKLKEQQDTFQALNDGQMKILREINEKLTQNQLKLDNFEKQMLNSKEITTNIGQLSSQKKARVSMGIIMGLPQNQEKAPAV